MLEISSEVTGVSFSLKKTIIGVAGLIKTLYSISEETKNFTHLRTLHTLLSSLEREK